MIWFAGFIAGSGEFETTATILKENGQESILCYWNSMDDDVLYKILHHLPAICPSESCQYRFIKISKEILQQKAQIWRTGDILYLLNTGFTDRSKGKLDFRLYSISNSINLDDKSNSIYFPIYRGKRLEQFSKQFVAAADEVNGAGWRLKYPSSDLTFSFSETEYLVQYEIDFVQCSNNTLLSKLLFNYILGDEIKGKVIIYSAVSCLVGIFGGMAILKMCAMICSKCQTDKRGSNQPENNHQIYEIQSANPIYDDE